MIKSELHKGLIKKGITQLGLTIILEQTDPMELTVRSGNYVGVDGDVFTLSSDVVLNFTSDPDFEKSVLIALVRETSTGDVDVWVDEVVQDGVHVHDETSPPGYGVIDYLVRGTWFRIPPNTSNLDDCDIFMLKVI